MGPQPTLMNDLERFRRRLEEHLGRPAKLLVFGSQATGRAGPESDVDLVIVSEAFRGRSQIRRGAWVLEAWDSPAPVDVLCYTPEEFDRLRNQVSIVRVAVEEGVEVGA